MEGIAPGVSGADAARAGSPYVGLRPFEREDRWRFFGRDRDATILCDKILGARLTLFYAQSGLGKSSILRTLVVPELEDEDCLVVYHDVWTGDRPAATLAEVIAARAKLPAPGGSLVETARSAAAATGRTLVLLLDQFEEFLIAHAQDLDPLRAEIGALVRARDADLRVVLALREELLAGLDPFRHTVPELYQSTFRLEPLGDDAVREAIARPAELAGGGVAPGLIDRLIADLRAENAVGAAPGADAPAAAAVDLPMLQLVCRELWSAGGDAGGGGAQLTEELYRSTGGARVVLDRYVLGVMPAARREQAMVARLMQMLAPPSGFKASYSPEDLAASTEIPVAAVTGALDRLARSGILRARAIGRANRYELLHDAFIRILAPWRDAVLQRARARRRLARAALVGVLGLAAIAGAVALQEWRDAEEYQRSTEGVFADLRALDSAERERIAEGRFSYVTNYLLYRRGGVDRFNRLRELLRANADLLPPRYGIDAATQRAPGVPSDWPVLVRYADGRPLHVAEFQAAWQEHATFMAASWGMPVPVRVRAERAASLTEERMRVSLDAVKSLEVRDVGMHDDQFIVSGRGLSGAAAEFVERFATDWRKLPEAGLREFYAVPRWSLPVWRLAGANVEPGSRFPALAIFLRMQAEPEKVFGAEMAEVILERAKERYPHTVAEARAARGDRLAADFAALVKLGRPATGLPLILDELADRPEGESAAVAHDVNQSLSAAESDPVERVRGKWPAAKDAKEASLDQKVLAAHREAAPWLPEVERPIRVEVGDALDAYWFQGEEFQPEFTERVEALRERLFSRFGFVLPPIWVRYGVGLPSESLRIEVLNQSASDADAAVIATPGASSLDRFIEKLTERAEIFRKRWITADTVSDRLAGVGEATRAWLAEGYSLTDLKNLLRGAVVDDAGRAAASSLPQEALLTSLPFWRQRLGDDAVAIGDALEALRIVRPGGGAVSASTERAIAALLDDDPAAAERLFDRAEPADAFAAAFQRRWLERRDEALVQRCQPGKAAVLSVEERAELARRVTAPRGTTDEAAHRRAALCLYAEFGRQKRRAHEAALLREIAARHADLARWSAEEAEWAAARIVERHEPLADAAPIAFASRLLAVVAAGDSKRHAEVLARLLEVCRRPGAMNWCFRVADEFVARDGISVYATLDLAIELSTSERERDLRRALELAALAERRLAAARPALGDQEADRVAAFVPYVAARADAALARYHDDAEADARALAGFRRLEASERFRREAIETQAALHRYRGRPAEAVALVEQMLAADPADSRFLVERLLLALGRGDREAIVGAIDALTESGGDESYAYATVAAAILAGHGDWQVRALEVISRRDRDADYLLMVLSAMKAGEGREEAERWLDRRTDRMARATWPERLRGGDATAWHEMLLASLRGEIPREAIFGPLREASAYAASDFAALPMPRRALLCEAHFYDAMRSRMEGDRAAMLAGLRAAVATGYSPYVEYSLATYLLARDGG